MTDTSESTEISTTEPLKYVVGDTVNVMRGKYRGMTAKVIDVDTVKRQYATKLTDGGGLAVINEANVKAPAEGQISVSLLVSAVRNADGDFEGLLEDLRTNVAGFSEAYDR